MRCQRRRCLADDGHRSRDAQEAHALAEDPRSDHDQRLLALERHSTDLARLTESQRWLVLKSPEYVQPSAAFVRAAEDLVEAAKHRDIDAAALDYVSLALKCFECHRYVNVKNSRIATR